MSEGPNRIRVEEIDWQGTLPFTNIFRSFRMAIHPSKIGLALAMVVSLYLWCCLLDLFEGAKVYPGERQQYQRIRVYEADTQAHSKPLSLAKWRADRRRKNLDALKSVLAGRVGGTPHGMLRLSVEKKTIAQITKSLQPYDAVVDEINKEFKDQYGQYENELDEAAQESDEDDLEGKEADKDEPDKPDMRAQDPQRVAKLIQDRRYLIELVRRMQPRGVFATAMHYKLASLNELVEAAANLNMGLGELLPQATGAGRSPVVGQSTSVVGVMKKLFITLPCWLFFNHGWFAFVYVIGAFALSALFGGAVARLAALHATCDERATNAAALGFGFSNWPWFVLAPLLPIIFGLVIAVGLMFGGFVMNLWVLDILGALLFPLALVLGLVIALTLIGLLAGYNLLWPAIAVEGTDAFDAISRAFSYVRGRTWHMIFYNVVALVYGAITYIFLSVVVYLTLLFTRTSVDWGYFRIKFSIDQFDSMMPGPVFGDLLQRVDWAMLGWSGKCAAVLIHLWVWLLVAVLVAYGISFYISASTWVYLLLRRAADGTEFDDVYKDLPPQPTETPQPVSSLADPAASSPDAPAPEHRESDAGNAGQDPDPEPGSDNP